MDTSHLNNLSASKTSARRFTRSRNGCWTCKRRRRKCDEKRPVCTQCAEKNLECAGYDQRLVWGVGIASRGYNAGAQKPRIEYRTCEMMSPGSLSQAQSSSDDAFPNTSITSNSPKELDEDASSLLRKFKESGYLTLCPMRFEGEENPILEEILPLADDSSSLMAGILAYQSCLSPNREDKFEKYYADALRLFRQDINCPLGRVSIATLSAGILLCSIGMNCRMPWTMHIHGLYAILSSENMFHEPTPSVTDIIETVAVFDIPVFVVGRQTPPLYMWRNHCTSNMDPSEELELLTGLPYSLLSIFSYMSDSSAEKMLWGWSGCAGELVQYHLWDAFRYAGIISARELQAQMYAHSPDTQPSPLTPGAASISVDILALRILACIDAVRRAIQTDAPGRLLVERSYLYPLFIAGSQAKSLPEQQPYIEQCFHELANTGPDPYYETPLIVLKELWAGKGSAEEIVRRWNWELALL
ncbi:hypothetical protein K469DRAFT_136061 [Zopfia rhizophila CBS 207.26]|uniref:Zn(2)-C6 fungal-type domain-containing protein n=1 Tax=Zopfia rhizophila CBS 207.26 TaxID=1314779 RepID=A0A6A6EUF3_9PEZI|nr:hypothetical protein K469DRAFT_136061 [Zopfia rhizophila CBS 207.26]